MLGTTMLAVLSTSFRKQRGARALLDAVGEALKAPPATLQ
jgi:hypothetical protein